MGTVLYDIVIQPVVFVIELAFSLAYRVLDDPGLSIVAVSIVVNAICTPLYAMADAKQDEERARQARMERWTSHIKRVFSGDERYMMLNAYYEEQGYKQWYAMGSSVSLLLQVPIFMAAYSYLSSLEVLRGAPFLMIGDLGAPDGLLRLGALSLNALPMLMTALNVVSSAIYTRGLSAKEKVQPFVLAALFLVLLYDRPSGLVFYWTCNQVFSLLRNVVTKLVPNAGAIMRAGLQGCVLLGCGYALMAGMLSSPKRLLGALAVLAAVEWALWAPRWADEKDDERHDGAWARRLFLSSALLLAVVAGLLIPSALIGTSPTEFVNPNNYVNPMTHLAHTASVAAGLFVLWGGVFFALSGQAGRRTIACCYAIVALVGLADYLVVLKELGDINISLIYDAVPCYSPSQQALGLLLVCGVVGVVLVLWSRLPSLLPPAVAILAVSAVALAVPNVVAIQGAADAVESDGAAQVASGEFFDEDGSIVPLIRLSKTGKNVVVLFMDRAIGGLLPYVLNEKPQIAAQLDGFTYYPNSLSFGVATVFGASPVYGGYEYTPTEMNKRADEPLPDKHNESLLVMPNLFANNGYRVTLLDAAQVDNQPTSPEFPQIESIDGAEFHYVVDAYTDYVFPELSERDARQFRRNLCYYSLFQMAPVFLRTRIYDEGNYLEPHAVVSQDDGVIRTRVNKGFIGNYSVLKVLDELTEVTDDERGTFMMMDNESTHKPSILSVPDYDVPTGTDETVTVDYASHVVDGQTLHLKGQTQLAHYHVNVAALLRLGEWFDYLRDQGVYDNTRIIVIADHGRGLGHLDSLIMDDLIDGESYDAEWVNPLLMVKDFGASGPLETSDEFMTNADTPSLAMAGLIDDPVNPYTGKPISMDEKTAHDQVITTSRNWHPDTQQQGNTFDTSDGVWLSVHDSIFDRNNWKNLGK